MTDINLIILIAAVVLGVSVLLIRRFSDNVGSIVLVLGVVITAAIVTGLQISSYRQQQQAAAEYADSTPAQIAAENNMPPPPTAATLPAITPAPALMKGPTGGAAPAAVRNPYSRS